jgi:uncharacterized membrane protein
MQRSHEPRKPSPPWLPLWVTGIALLVVAVALLTPPHSILGKCDVVGYAICHRIPERSFHLAGRPLPLCARCTGTYLGALTGFVAMWALGHRQASNLPPTRVIVLLVGFIASMGIDGLNSYLSFFPNAPHLYEPSNLLRLATGTLNGLALSIIVLPVFNFTLWREINPRRSIRNLRELAVAVALAAVMVLTVQTELDFLLYPLAIMSTLSVLIMLTAVNTMIVLIVTRRENMAETWLDALLPLSLGLLTTLVEITGMDLLRLTLMQQLGLPF